ncbi:hypothetical protein [Psychromonas hadalis]|uniref:hypothetical protein n=1 Tax=Psychromonas hadalis TaxID=211669 RepID=UPI0003B2E3A4|nr:hypothetical protein [Psychromonas hadalis]
MLRVSVVLLFLCSLVACNPFANNETGNQFVLKKNKLFFMGHDLVDWQGKTLPECELCSFNIHTKKMLPGAMLFRQINNERGDLVFLIASNIRYSFALQTGGQSYSIRVKIEDGKLALTTSSTNSLLLAVNQQKKLTLGGLSYFVLLHKVNLEKESVDVVIWRDNPL